MKKKPKELPPFANVDPREKLLNKLTTTKQELKNRLEELEDSVDSDYIIAERNAINKTLEEIDKLIFILNENKVHDYMSDNVIIG